MTIKVKNIDVTIDGKRILENISAHFHEKKFIGLIGPNGSGKSTLLKCICRLLKDYSGEITYGSCNIKMISVKEMAREIAVVAQHNHYAFDFLVKDIVMMGRTPYQKALQSETKADGQLVEQMLDKVGLLDYKNQDYSTLSGGEQQRVILARALVQEPNILVLDEPTNHLDIHHQLDLLKLVKGLNITVISAIHDLNLALHFCDDIFVLQDGKLIESGHPKDVLTTELIKKVYQVHSERVMGNDGKPYLVFPVE